MTDRPARQPTFSAGGSALLVALLVTFGWALAVVGSAATTSASASATSATPSLSVWSVPSSTYPNENFRLAASAPLPASGLSVSENGRPVRTFTVKPLTTAGVVLVIDRSRSMSGAPLSSDAAALRAFVAERNPSEPVGIIFMARTRATFQPRAAPPIVAVPMTTNTAELDQAIAKPPARAWGTLVGEATYKALTMLQAAHVANGTVIVVSDGSATGGNFSVQDVGSELQSAGVHLYAFGMDDRAFKPTVLQSLAFESGGTYASTTPSTVVASLRQLGAQVAHQYSLSYRSPTAPDSAAAVSVSAPGFPAATTSYTTGATGTSPQSTSFIDSTAAVILISLLIAVLIGVAVYALTRRHNEVSSRVGEFVLPVTGGGQSRERSLVELALGDAQARNTNRSPRWRALGLELDVAGLRIAPVNYVVITIVLTLVVGWFMASELGSILGALVAIVVPIGALMLVRTKADRQRRAFDAQLPDNLSVVASAMRAGQTFLGALQAVVDTAPEPSKSELRRAVTDAQLGVPVEEALGALGDRLQSSDFQHVALIAQLQRETGGNTAEVVELVADTIRERLELRQMVRALTAQGRLAGYLLSALPVGLLLIVSVINPTYIHPMFHSTIGLILLIAAAVLTIAGSFVIKKIVTIEL